MIAIAVVFLAPQIVQAAWVPFTVTNVNGHTALGWEQISIAPGTGAGGNGLAGPGFDYSYVILNTGAPIDGFFFDVGVPNNAAALSAFTFASAGAGSFCDTAVGGGDDGLFPAVAAPGGVCPNIVGAFGAINPYSVGPGRLNPVNGPGVNPLPPPQGTLQPWGFEQFYNAGFTGYVARFYANTPGNPFGLLPTGFVTRFDVFSPFGPVAGGGGVDPFGSGNFIGIDDGSGGLSDLIASPAVTPCDPSIGGCDTSYPAGIMGAPGAGGVVPEPSTFALTAGLLIAGFSARCLRRKNRSREYC